MSERISNTLQTIKNDVDLQNLFFKRLSEASNPLEWLLPLRDAGYFDPKNNPKPEIVPNKEGYYTVPHWNMLDGLVNMAVKNEANPDDKVSLMLLEIIDRIITYRDNGERINNYRTDWKMLEAISHLPIQYIGIQHIEFIANVLAPGAGISLVDRAIGSLFIPKLVRAGARELLVEILPIILNYVKTEKGYAGEYVSVMENYYFKKTIEKNKDGIGSLCPIEAANIGIGKIKEIIGNDESHFNCMWIPTIEDNQEKYLHDKYEYQLVKFVRCMLESANSSELESLIHGLLQEKHNIFTRIAYHIINQHYGSLAHLLWEIPHNPLNDYATHELYELLKNRCSEFNSDQISIVLAWVEEQEFHFSESVAGDTEKENLVKAYRKKEWLSSLLPSGDKTVRERYDYYNSINDAEVDHPGMPYWSSGAGWVKDVSPIEESEFKKMSNLEVAAYINGYQEPKDDVRSWKDFTRVNLGSSFRTFIASEPSRYTHDIDPFLSIPRKYQYEFLRGLEEAWRNQKDFSWDELLPYMKGLIETPDLWPEKYAERDNDYNQWIVNTVADLIREGTRDDKHAFASDLLPLAEEILVLLLENVKWDTSSMNNLVTSALNSSKGKVFMAALDYSLRYARLYCKEKENRWVDIIKTEFTKRLDKSFEPSLDFSVITGWFLSNLSYLDNEWVSENINSIFDAEDDKYWEAAFSSYIVMETTVYEVIYKLLRDNGHYEKALSHKLTEEHAADKLIQHIVIGYLAGWDAFPDDDSLLGKLLAANNTEYLSDLVRFVGTFTDKDNRDISSKIKPLWRAVFEKVSPNLATSKYREIAANLALWLPLATEIDDDIFEWVKVSAQTIGENWHSGEFIRYLQHHVSKSPEKVGALYLEMLQTGIYPDYIDEDAIVLVQTLYDLSQRELANKICNLYISKGNEFLRPIFMKYNKP